MPIRTIIEEPIKGATATDAFTALKRLGQPFIFSGGCGPARFSYVGAGPLAVLKTSPDGVTTAEGAGVAQSGYSDPFEGAARVMETLFGETLFGEPSTDGSTGRFNGGAVGYFAYDLKGLIESGLRTARRAAQEPALPLSVLGFFDPVFVYDHELCTGMLVSTGRAKGCGERIKRYRSLIEDAPRLRDTGREAPVAAGAISSNFTREGYIHAIRRAKEYISEGDIYQINLSQTLRIPFSGDPFSLYLGVVATNPTAFSSFMDFGAFQIVSNTPERLLRAGGGTIETSPIKGTRARGADEAEDRRLVEELTSSVKERAEHVMIVDLERNDLGRVSVPGSVEVTSFETVETYPGLHHMVSTVRGRIRPGLSPLYCLRTAFPGGSITGAPKIRAMEIIDELEPTARGVYTGGLGWVDASGSLDMSMAIRTAVCSREMLSLSVGGGIVADSVPEEEYTETMLKAGSFLDALGIRHGTPS